MGFLRGVALGALAMVALALWMAGDARGDGTLSER